MSEIAITSRAPQRLRALERANEIRLARAELKRQIAYGAVSAADVILAPPLEANTWAIAELLLSQRRWGDTRCRKFLSRNQISENKQVGALTPRQRQLLAHQLCPNVNGQLSSTSTQLLASAATQHAGLALAPV